MKCSRVFAVGDIHGEYKMLMSLLKNIKYDSQKDFLIFIGDYIDRGQYSCEVLNFAVELSKQDNVVFLKGNHDQMMLDEFLPKEEQNHDVDKFVELTYNEYWEYNGGNVTKKKLLKDKNLDTYIEFLNSLSLYHTMTINDENYYFCHAGIRPNASIQNQNSHDLLWIRSSFFEDYKLVNPIIVAGHTRVKFIEDGSTKPIIRRNMILLDTGAGYRDDAKLSCVELCQKEIYQS